MSGGYLSTQGHLVGDHLASGYDPLGLDNSASYLGMETGPGGLRDTAIAGGFGDPGHGDLDGRASLLASHRFVGGCVSVKCCHTVVNIVNMQTLSRYSQ